MLWSSFLFQRIPWESRCSILQNVPQTQPPGKTTLGKVPSNYTKRSEQILNSLCLKSGVPNAVIQSASSLVSHYTLVCTICSCNVGRHKQKCILLSLCNNLAAFVSVVAGVMACLTKRGMALHYLKHPLLRFSPLIHGGYHREKGQWFLSKVKLWGSSSFTRSGALRLACLVGPLFP
jgi:hypothetical protein